MECKIKDDFDERFRRLSELKGIKLCICEINEFEIKSKLRKEYSIPLNRVYHIYDEVMDKLKHIIKIKIDLVKFTPELTKWMLANDLDFKDALLINIAQLLQIPFVTSERRADRWKNAYDGVMSDREFWSKLEKY